jgi:hypothetical protein
MGIGPNPQSPIPKNRIKNFIQGDKNLQNKLDELLNTIITN